MTRVSLLSCGDIHKLRNTGLKEREGILRKLFLALKGRPPDMSRSNQFRNIVAEGFDNEVALVLDVTHRHECLVPVHKPLPWGSAVVLG